MTMPGREEEEEEEGSVTSGGTVPSRREVLGATDDGPIAARVTHGRRGVLKRAVAAAAAAVGLPLFGSAGVRADGADDELLDRFARPEYVRASVDDNRELIGALGRIGLFDEGYRSMGFQVSAVTVDGERVPEHRLFAKSPYGTVSTVVSPEGVPLGGYATVVTTEAEMERAPFEWPLERMGELADGRRTFRIEPDGWAEVRRDAGVRDDIERVRCVDDPVECRTSSGECWFVGCCGVVERTGPCGDSSSDRHEGCRSCEDDPNEDCDSDGRWDDVCFDPVMCNRTDWDGDGEAECWCLDRYADYYGC